MIKNFFTIFKEQKSFEKLFTSKPFASYGKSRSPYVENQLKRKDMRIRELTFEV